METQESEGSRTNEERQIADAVDVLSLVIERDCQVAIGSGAFVEKDEFQHRFLDRCKEFQIEPPSPSVLGSILVTCYRFVRSDTVRCGSSEIPVWMNLKWKDGNKGAVP